MSIIKKYKGYILLSIIFIIIICIIYITGGKKDIQYVNMPDTSYRMHVVDSLNFIISELKEDNIKINNDKKTILMKIQNNEPEYKNKITDIEHSNADSNYNALREIIRTELK